MKKKALLLSIILIIGFTGCGKKEVPTETGQNSTLTAENNGSPINAYKTVPSSIHIGKGMQFGMTYEEVEKNLYDNFNNLDYLGEDPDVATVLAQGHERDLARFVGKEISGHIQSVSYCYENDRLYRVEYILKENEFADLKFACEAFEIPYDENNRDYTGYYSVYTDDDIYIEVHNSSASVYEDGSEGPFYIYYEPTYDITSAANMWHKHTWSFPQCNGEKVCEGCGATRPSGRKHVIDSYGFCQLCGADLGIPLTAANVKLNEYITFDVTGNGSGTNWIGYNIDFRSVSEDYRFDNVSLSLYCNETRDDHEVLENYNFTDITLDENGYAHVEGRENNTIGMEDFRADIISGRVHRTSPHGKGVDPSVCMHEHLTYYGRDGEKMNIDTNDENYKAGKFHDYASYIEKYPYYAKCDDCGEAVFGKLTLTTDSPLMTAGLAYHAETDGFLLKYSIEPSPDFTYSDLECYFWLSVLGGDSYLEDSYYTRNYVIDDSGEEGVIDLEDEIKAKYPDATGIVMHEEGYGGGYNCNFVGRAYINDQSNIRDREYVNIAYPDYILPDSDKRDITTEELKMMDKEIIDRAINEIYARHGRKFRKLSFQKYFEKKAWYKGTINPEDFDETILNEYEKHNVATMREYEKEKWPWAD